MNDVPKVSLRGGFSDREGIKPVNTKQQISDLDERTRKAIANTINGVYTYTFEHDTFGEEKRFFLRDLLQDVYVQKITYDTPYERSEKKIFDDFINRTIIEDDYDSALTVVEYIVRKLERINREQHREEGIVEVFNRLFEREYVGYRFVNETIVKVTDPVEIEEINEAISVSFDNVKKHLEKALIHLADRKEPDYENSIKESISSVEAMCSIILGEKGTLGDTLKKIEKKGVLTIHPALKSAFEKLYGYAGDAESGIRHAAGLGGRDTTFAEAKYMLVTCSAFINYLITNMAD